MRWEKHKLWGQTFLGLSPYWNAHWPVTCRVSQGQVSHLMKLINIIPTKLLWYYSEPGTQRTIDTCFLLFMIILLEIRGLYSYAYNGTTGILYPINFITCKKNKSWGQVHIFKYYLFFCWILKWWRQFSLQLFFGFQWKLNVNRTRSNPHLVSVCLFDFILSTTTVLQS